MSDDVFGEDVDLEKIENPEESVQEVEASTEEHAEPEQPVVEPKEEKTVPLAALLDERNEWKQRYAELEARLSKGNERVEKLFEALNKTDQPSPPEYEQDPLGNLKYSTESVRKEIEETRKWREQLENSQKTQQQFQEFHNRVNSAEARFAQEHPDYWEAAQHVAKTQKETLELLGVPNEHLDTALQRHLMGLVATAMQTGKDPAKVIYDLAKKGGFSGKKPQDMETLKKGVEASKSVPSGKNNETSLSLEGLAKLSDEDFDKLVDDPTAWSKLGRAA